MKKGYYIYAENCLSSGVSKKVKMQIDALSDRYIMKGVMVKTSERTVVQRVKGLLFWNSFGREYQCALNEIESPDFVYIRKEYVDKMYLGFLRDIKEQYPMCKIIVEIPTYPYKGEMLSHWYTTFMYVKEIIYRHKYKENIDRFVTFSDDSEILGVPTIQIMNGVNVKSISPIEPANEYNPNEIHLIAVALFSRHHGYERVIRGLYEYYQIERHREVYFHMVGDGPGCKKYENLVKKYKLEKYVRFHGSKYGKELDGLYNFADAGLAGYGGYKDGVFKASGIKTREYLAKGIPVITGMEDDLLFGVEYGLTFPNNATSVDIKKVTEYLDNLYLHKGKHMVNKEIRDFAYRNADNKVTLLPVMEYIDS